MATSIKAGLAPGHQTKHNISSALKIFVEATQFTDFSSMAQNKSGRQYSHVCFTERKCECMNEKVFLKCERQLFIPNRKEPDVQHQELEMLGGGGRHDKARHSVNRNYPSTNSTLGLEIMDMTFNL